MPDLRNLVKKYYPVILLVIVVSISADMLGFSDILTGPILAQREQETILARLEETFPDTTESVILDDIYVLTTDDKIIGYAFLAEGLGIGGKIQTLVILEDKATVKAIFVIRQTETPGLGDLITSPDFTRQFTGKIIEDIEPTTEGGQIDAITGATISSTVVIETVRNTALEQVKALPSAEEVRAALLAKRKAEQEAEQAEGKGTE
jgi:electron transport complex protein RnfG